jgi:ornithine cyclodeaminase
MYELIDEGTVPPLRESEDLGGIIAEGRPPRPGRTVFIASGMAVFDVAWGADLLASARSRGIGTSLELWGEAPDNGATEGVSARAVSA